MSTTQRILPRPPAKRSRHPRSKPHVVRAKRGECYRYVDLLPNGENRTGHTKHGIDKRSVTYDAPDTRAAILDATGGAYKVHQGDGTVVWDYSPNGPQHTGAVVHQYAPDAPLTPLVLPVHPANTSAPSTGRPALAEGHVPVLDAGRYVFTLQLPAAREGEYSNRDLPIRHRHAQRGVVRASAASRQLLRDWVRNHPGSVAVEMHRQCHLTGPTTGGSVWHRVNASAALDDTQWSTLTGIAVGYDYRWMPTSGGTDEYMPEHRKPRSKPSKPKADKVSATQHDSHQAALGDAAYNRQHSPPCRHIVHQARS